MELEPGFLVESGCCWERVIASYATDLAAEDAGPSEKLARSGVVRRATSTTNLVGMKRV